jgi:hypothetical protein
VKIGNTPESDIVFSGSEYASAFLVMPKVKVTI